MNKVETLFSQIAMSVAEFKMELKKLPFYESEKYIKCLRDYISDKAGFVIYDDEEFVVVKDYKNGVILKEYLISSYGKIFNLKTDRFLLHSENKSGYGSIGLKVNGKQTVRLIHQLVAFNFIGEPIKYEHPVEYQYYLKSIVRHLNGDSLDNRVSNLIYGTYEENAKDRKLHAVDGQKVKRKKRKREIVEFCKTHSEERYITERINNAKS